MNAKKMTSGIVLLLVLFLSISPDVLAQGQSAAKQLPGKWALGAEAGLQAGTASNDTALALGLNADYYLDQYFSVRPLMQLGFTDDQTQIGVPAQAKHTFDFLGVPELKPHLQAGLGFLDMDQPPAGPKNNETGFLVPFGGGLEWELSKNLVLGSTFLLNFTDADIQRERPDNLSMTGFFGLRARL